MNPRLIPLAWIVLGIASIAMPWVVYPKAHKTAYGYMGDGIITSCIFVIILILNLIELKPKRQNIAFPTIKALLASFLIFAAFSAIYSIKNQQKLFTSDNPFVATATAGFKAGFGLYVMGISGLIVLLFSILEVFHRKKEKNILLKNNFSLKTGIWISAAGIAILFILNRQYLFSHSPAPKTIEAAIKKDIENMGQCLISGDYKCFVNFNHPIIVQSYGGPEKMIDLLKGAMLHFKENNVTYSQIQFLGVEQVETANDNIQAIISQKVTILKNSVKTYEDQKVLAISDDKGKNWHYISLTGLTVAELVKHYPYLNPKLKF